MRNGFYPALLVLSSSFLEVFIRRLIWTLLPLSVTSSFSLALTPSVSATRFGVQQLFGSSNHPVQQIQQFLYSLPQSFRKTLYSSKRMGKPMYIKIYLFRNIASVYKNVYNVFPLHRWKYFWVEQTAVKQNQENSGYPVFSLWLDYKHEGWDQCSLGHHSITVTVERWDDSFTYLMEVTDNTIYVTGSLFPDETFWILHSFQFRLPLQGCYQN